jgi:hypothetical protein
MAFEFVFDAPDNETAVVIHNDGRTVWAYLHTPSGIVSDVWLFNLEAAPAEIEPNPERDRPPLNAARYCSPEAVPVISYPDDVEIRWRYGDGRLRSVEISVEHQPLARLAPGVRPGWSRFAAVDGPCAQKLT